MHTFVQMLDLIRHIEYLLTEHDCVVVPGLGGFVLQYVPAYFSDDRKSMQPPGKQIVFNPSLSYNDGLLAHSLMQSRNMDYANAVAFIEHNINEMKKNLSKFGDSFVFGNLGTFVLSEELSLIFEPDTAYLAAASFFGLKKINICPLNQLHKEEAVEVEDINEKKDVLYIPVNKNFIRRMVAAAVIVIVLLMISTPISEINTTSDYASMVSSELFGHNTDLEAEEISISQLQQEDSVIEVLGDSLIPKIENEEILNGVSEEEAMKSYIVVVATLSGKQAALRQLEHFKSQGVKDDLKIYETSNKVRIYIDSFSDKEDARKYLRSLRSGNSFFPDAWIMTVEK
ncbi:HU domain-containing protein [Coprobacter sp.]